MSGSVETPGHDGVEEGESLPELPAKPSKPKWMTIYNASMHGAKVKMHDGGQLMPGKTGKVPYALGLKLVQRVPWIKRAERGDVMG